MITQPLAKKPFAKILLTLALPGVLSLIVIWSVLHLGLPTLRHDWRLPSTAAQLPGVVAWYADGWNPIGFGSIQAYPTFYPLTLVLWPLAHVAPPLLFAAVIIGLTVFAIARSGIAIGQAFTLAPFAQIALAGVLTLNPWVYTEYVAGHIFMVSAYAVLCCMAAEILRPVPRPFMLLLIAALAIVQLEFLVIVFIPLAIWLYRKQAYRALAMVCIATLPLALGIVTNYATIGETPFGLDWERSAALWPASAVLLRGYAAHYDRAFATITPALIIITLCVLYGLRRAFTDQRIRYFCGAGLLALLYACGSHGPVAPLFEFFVLHVPESGLFRELYDLIAFSALAYTLILAHSFRAQPIAGAIGSMAAAALLVPWISSPIAAQIVPAQQLPVLSGIANADERIALLPAFQPLSLRAQKLTTSIGSGTDPDAFDSPGYASPINEWFPSSPVDGALALAERTGSYSQLAALGVGSVIFRPYLQSDYASIADQGVAPFTSRFTEIRQSRVAARPIYRLVTSTKVVPIVSIASSQPTLSQIGNDLQANSIFFADETRGLQRIRPSLLTHDPRQAWVDARFTVVNYPEFSDAHGGVVTQSNQPLQVPAGAKNVLGVVHGELRDANGALVALGDPSSRKRWMMLPERTHTLYCIGNCMLAGFYGELPLLPAATAIPAPALWQPVSWTPHSAWWLSVKLPADTMGTLRFNERFDTHWIALENKVALPHVRLDTAANAWLLPPRARPQTIEIIEWVAALQAALEVFAFVFFTVCAIDDARKVVLNRSRTRRENTHPRRRKPARR